MANYTESIARFCDKVDQTALETIVKYVGIALQSPDASSVAASDPNELETIKEGYCAKKLELTAEEATQAIDRVAEIMKHDAAKCRVTFYYLLADKTGNLNKLA